MPIPQFSVADFASALAKLMPLGRAWSRDAESTQQQVLATLAPSFERSAARASNLIADSFPGSTVELLPEWEASLGLPDPCQGEAPTIGARQAQVLARFIGNGGQSIPYLTAFCENLGFPGVTFGEHAPFRMGVNAMGDALEGDGAWFRLTVNASASISLEYFRMGADAMGEPLWWGNNAVLSCELARVVPGHVTLEFVYGA